MNESYKTKLILAGSSLVKTLLVAGLILSLGWGLVQIAKWKNRKPTVGAGSDGTIVLLADDAEIHGIGGARTNLLAGKRNIGWWDKTGQFVSWRLNVAQSGNYRVVLEYALGPKRQTDFQIEFSDNKTLSATATSTGGWNAWREMEVGIIELEAGKKQALALKAVQLTGKGVMNLVSLRLKPE